MGVSQAEVVFSQPSKYMHEESLGDHAGIQQWTLRLRRWHGDRGVLCINIHGCLLAPMPAHAAVRAGPVWLCTGQPALGKPGSELARGAHAVIDHSGIDFQVADQIGMVRPPVPYVFDTQHRAALLGGAALAQLLMPAGAVKPRGHQTCPSDFLGPCGLWRGTA
jgi:hypothetical protein